MKTSKETKKTTTARKKATVRKTGTRKSTPVKKNQQFRTYKDAIKYLFTRTDYETQQRLRYNVTTFNLDRMFKLLKELGNPEKKFASIHIAGSKGKGSTATMLACMLEENGYSVGLYTSPHVTSLHERIVVNSQMIDCDCMRKLINRIHATVEKLHAEGDAPTFFELMTAMSFMHFADSEVDFAIVETGLGGRLDSTNVLEPILVGITNISIDHQNLLGKTIDKIAGEKAGVIKESVPVVTVRQEPAAMRELRKKALEVSATLNVTGDDIDFSYRFESSREHGPHTRICLTTPTSKYEHLRVPLPGEHQASNCGLALAMLDKLKAMEYDIDDAKAIQGLSKVSMPGRMENICDDPRVIIDAAHNAASIRALIQAIGQHVPYDSMIVIFGCNNDKDIPGILNQLQYGADKVIFTRSNNPKAVSPDDLAEVYTEISGKMCQTAYSLREAIRIACNAIGREDLICITGSFYLIGQAKEMFLAKQQEIEAAN